MDVEQEYKKLEIALFEELQKPNFSSRAEDYMKSEAYLNYKTFICKNPDYIEMMFRCFLFKSNPQGLYGYLIDDIIKGVDVPTVEDYQKTIRKLMNIERNKNKNELSR